MPLTNGTRIGPCQITGVIGAGGMGEVYRARDTKLDRSVAIKVLPDLFATTARAWATWDVLPDGKQFVLIQHFARPRTSVTLVQNWFQELQNRD